MKETLKNISLYETVTSALTFVCKLYVLNSMNKISLIFNTNTSSNVQRNYCQREH